MLWNTSSIVLNAALLALLTIGSLAALRTGMRKQTVFLALALFAGLWYGAYRFIPMGRHVRFDGDVDTVILPNGVELNTGQWYSKEALIGKERSFGREEVKAGFEGEYLTVSGFPDTSRAQCRDGDGVLRDLLLWWSVMGDDKHLKCHVTAYAPEKLYR